MHQTRNNIFILLFIPMMIFISSCGRKGFSLSYSRKLQTVSILTTEAPSPPIGTESPAGIQPYVFNTPASLPTPNSIPAQPKEIEEIKKSSTKLKKEIIGHTLKNEKNSNTSLLKLPPHNKITLRQRKGPKYYYENAVAGGNKVLAIGCIVLLVIFIGAALIIAL